MDLEALRRRVAGTVIGRDDARYEAARSAAVWNDLVPERRPDAVVRVAGADDVVEALRFAREQRVKVSVRSGGHSWCGASLGAGGLLLDLGGLKDVAVNVAARTATVEPAVTGGELSARLAAHGLAFPVGHCSSVAVGGYLLSGGFGWNAGAWGPACFSVSAIEVVTADGESRRADDGQNTDLLWAARGAGPGFFGIVTRYHLQLQPLPAAVRTSTFVFPMASATRAARWAAEASAAMPRSVELLISLAGAPPEVADRCKSDDGWACTVIATVFAGEPEEAETMLAPLLGALPSEECLSATLHRSTPFPVLFEGIDVLFPERHRCLADTVWSAAEPADLVEVARSHVSSAPSASSLILCPIFPPPRADDPTLPDAAFSMTARSFALCYAIWDDPSSDDANRAWHGDLIDALEPLAVGHYVGESDIFARPSRAERSFAPANWQRLQALRRRYDPDSILGGNFESF